MKIEIDDMVVSGLVQDLVDEVVKVQMKAILNEEDDYSHPDDVKYYKNLKKAARTIYNYYSVAGVEL